MLHAKDTWSYLRERGSPMFKLLASLIPKECKFTLDVGCGDALILDHLSTNIFYDGFDISDFVIDKNYQVHKERIALGVCNFYNDDMFNPSMTANYDCILFFGIFPTFKPEKILDLINLYIQKYHPSYILIEDIKNTDLQIIEKNFNVIEKLDCKFDLVDRNLAVGPKEILNRRQILLVKIK